jgi:hypothetical protein
MTDTNNAAQTSGKKKAYNFDVKQVETAFKGKNANGKTLVRFKGELVIGGKTVKRTISAQGEAADLIIGKLRKGNTLALRCIFERAPANDNGRGGEYMVVVGEPLPPKQKAA